MEIIPATENHIPEIIELWIEFMDFHQEIEPALKRGKDGHLAFEKHLRDSMQTEDSQVLLALDNNEVVGFSISQISKPYPVYEQENYGLISSIAVKTGHRRKRVGEQLLVKISEWLEFRNIDRIELSVVARNQVGYSFWKKHGFKDYMHRLYLDR
ncbi:GNAT family N-acetyltransferase [Chloroflexota bacterium]